MLDSVAVTKCGRESSRSEVMRVMTEKPDTGMRSRAGNKNCFLEVRDGWIRKKSV